MFSFFVRFGPLKKESYPSVPTIDICKEQNWYLFFFFSFFHWWTPYLLGFSESHGWEEVTSQDAARLCSLCCPCIQSAMSLWEWSLVKKQKNATQDALKSFLEGKKKSLWKSWKNSMTRQCAESMHFPCSVFILFMLKYFPPQKSSSSQTFFYNLAEISGFIIVIHYILFFSHTFIIHFPQRQAIKTSDKNTTKIRNKQTLKTRNMTKQNAIFKNTIR